MAETGRSPGTRLSERLNSPSLTNTRNSLVMVNTSSTFSPSPTLPSMIVSSPSIKQYGGGQGVSETLNSLISIGMPTSKSLTWIRSGWQSAPDRLMATKERERSMQRDGRRMKPATSGTTANVTKRKRSVEGSMCVTTAGSVDTKGKNAEVDQQEEPEGLHLKRPKYLERSVWADPDSSPSYSPTA